MPSLDTFAEEKLARIEANGRLREPVVTRALTGEWTMREGRRLLSFSGNDYLALRDSPEVRAAAIAAISEHGTGAGASYLVTGKHPLYDELESELSAFIGSEAACVFGSGYLANIGTIPALAGRGDLILLDELSHACAMTGARLAGSAVHLFRHNDVLDLKRKLQAHRGGCRNAIVITEGVFSMDGDVAPLPALSTVAREHDAWLMVDDAHGFGTLGHGRGAAFIEGAEASVDVMVGTLSKALASYGGFVCASASVIALLRNRARSFAYATALPPASVAAALAALRIIRRDPGRTASPLSKARGFTQLLRMRPAMTAIVPLIVGTPHRAMRAAAELERDGFLVVPIRPPTVPEGTARLRVSFSAAHSPGDVSRLADAVRDRLMP